LPPAKQADAKASAPACAPATSACNDAKPVVHHPKKKVTPPATVSPATFDFHFNGDIWNSLQALTEKQPQLTVTKTGTPLNISVHLDLHGVVLTDALRSIGEQAGTSADVIYSSGTNTARLVYRDKVDVGTSAVDESHNWQAGGTARPVMGADGLLMFPFGQYQPTLTCQPLRACDIQLQQGELVNNVILGDTVRWIPAPATTGNGNQAIPHVIVKPTEVGLQTNLIITTNRRTYMLTLKASDVQYISRVGFYYPQDMVQDWNGQAEAARRKADEDSSRKVSDLPITNIEQLNLDGYEINGDRDLAWYPVRVFDEGTHVWIQMPATIKASEAPALILIGSDGNSELVNYRVKEAEQGGLKVTYYIVDKIFTKAALIIGVGGDQQKVEITKKVRTSSNSFGLYNTK
jgi:type IV secretion system protein VirB9